LLVRFAHRGRSSLFNFCTTRSRRRSVRFRSRRTLIARRAANLPPRGHLDGRAASREPKEGMVRISKGNPSGYWRNPTKTRTRPQYLVRNFL
jgi:hypothetical protein